MGDQRPESEPDRLLRLTAGYVLEHGIAGLTLRRLGLAIGTNNRMLLYYFGSKEQLIARALLTASAGYPALTSAISALGGPGPLADRLNDCWARIAAPANLPFHRLFFEVFGVAAHQPGRFDEFLGRVGNDWANQVAEYLRADGVPPAEAALLARELVALWRGLQFDLLSAVDADTLAASHAAAADAFAERCAHARAGAALARAHPQP